MRNKPQAVVPVTLGFGSVSIMTTGSIGVSEDDQRNYQDPWDYEITISTSGRYHDWQPMRSLYLIDSDGSSALLITGNMTNTNTQDGIDKIVKAAPPYVLFARNNQFPPPFRGFAM